MTAAAAPQGPMFTPLRVWSALFTLLTLAVVVFIILFQWNWLRGPLARLISARLDRPVAIFGNLDVHPWSLSPTATVNGLVIGNPPWAGRAPMASLPRLKVQLKLVPLVVDGKLELPLLQADRPNFTLLKDPSGRSNWTFGEGGSGHALKLPPIAHLIINNGTVRYDDEIRRLRFSGVMTSSEQVVGPGRGTFRFVGAGTIRNEPFRATATGGPLIQVDANRPYPFTAHITAGATQVVMDGAFTHPFNFGQLSGRLHVSGPDMSDLYRLTGVTLPNTPPYNLAGGFAREGAYYAFEKIHGRVGDSDLAGSLSVDRRSRRPFIRANLASRRLRLADLTAVIGGAPRHPAGHTLSPQQKVVAAHLAAQHRLLPDSRLDVARIRAADADLIYRAQSVDAGKLPVKGLYLKLGLARGLMTIDPLRLSLPQGDLAGLIRLNARAATPVTAIDLRLANGRIETVIGRSKGVPAVEGGLYARAALTGTGDSVRTAAASANGALTLAVPNGRMRKTLSEAMGLNAANLIYLLITKDRSEAPIHCAVADFKAQGGVLNVQSMVVDTDAVVATGSGQIDLRNETMDLVLAGKNKKFRIFRIPAPITFKGPLEHPKAGVELAKAAPQVAASVALGAVVWPLAAILPFVGPGVAKSPDCIALTSQAQARGAPVGHRHAPVPRPGRVAIADRPPKPRG